MNKYLFTDGISEVKELQSTEELQTHIESVPFQDNIRIWIFNSNEWIGYAAFKNKYPFVIREEIVAESYNTNSIPIRTSKGKQWLKNFLFACGAIAGIFFIFNFTKIKWTTASPVNITAVRPANFPVMNIDSLIIMIENYRGKVLDRSTRTNFRLRNTWPERIELRLQSDRETSSGGSRYFNIDISIDNTTGFNLDEAIVKFIIWKNNKVNVTDTLHFGSIRYDKPSVRHLKNSYRGDSLSVSFESIKAKSFNFYYSASGKNNSGNNNDKWFYRE
jgi:hypothetical protein